MIHALILTAVVNGLTTVVKAFVSSIVWNSEKSLTAGVLLAFIVGMIFAFAANKDLAHGLLRKVGFTTQTSYPSEWYSAFIHRKGYVVLHLEGERRLYGWPEEWPSSPESGHFRMTKAEWLIDEDGDRESESICLPTKVPVPPPTNQIKPDAPPAPPKKAPNAD